MGEGFEQNNPIEDFEHCMYIRTLIELAEN